MLLVSLPQAWWWWHLYTVFFPFPFPVFPQSGLQQTQGPLRFTPFLIGTSWEGVNKMPVYFRWGTDNRLKKWFHSSLAGWSSEFIGVTYRAWVRIERLMGDSKTTVSSKSPSQQGLWLRHSTYLEFLVQLPYGLLLAKAFALNNYTSSTPLWRVLRNHVCFRYIPNLVCFTLPQFYKHPSSP